MALIDSKKYDDRYERNIADSIKLCRITGVRSIVGQPKDGKPRMDQDWITFALVEPALSTDGETLSPGFFKDVSINTYPDGTNGDDKLANANRMNEVLQRALVIAALGLPANTKDASAQLAAQGGLDALKNKIVRVQFKAKDGRQNVVAIMAAKADEIERANNNVPY